MKMPTPYEQLRSRINVLLPERLELGFGCEVVLKDFEQLTWTVLYRYDLSTRDMLKVIGNETCHQRDTHIKEVSSILGLPLTLADVLRVIERKDNYANNYALDTEIGSLLIEEHDFKYKPTGLKMDLSLPVSQWPEDTLKSLLEILK